MLVELQNGIGLDIVLALQNGRSGLLDNLATLLHEAGTTISFILILTLIYWSLNRVLGIHLIFTLVFAGIWLSVLKLLFQAPRPSDVSDLVLPLVEQYGFGMPSGHVMLNLIVWGYVAYYVRQRWLSVLITIYVLLMTWSRVYAGVHFPQDVIAGLLFGLLGLWIYIRIEGPAGAFFAERSALVRVGIASLTGVVIVLLPYGENGETAIAGLLVGAVIGLELEARYVRFSDEGMAQQRILRYVIGILLFAAAAYGLRAIIAAINPNSLTLQVLRYVLTGILLVYVWPWVGQRIGLFPARRQPAPS